MAGDAVVAPEGSAAHARTAALRAPWGLPARTAVVLAALLAPCGPAARAQTSRDGLPAVPIAWSAVDSLNARLPPGIRAFAGWNDSLPLRAWYVSIREPDPAIETRVEASRDADGKETVSDFARDAGVCVAVNGGYFEMAAQPAVHLGLLLTGRGLRGEAMNSVVRDTVTYPAARAAIGFTPDGGIELEWAVTRRDTVFALPEPPANAPGRPGVRPDSPDRHWPVRTALGAGPMLLRDGRARITADEEVFFGTSIPRTHPRTAAGRTADGNLLVLVVDGRQGVSRGVTLPELASVMRDLGAVDALNLDGGGSSTLVVLGVRLNRPLGGEIERQVVSALVVDCDAGR